MFTTLYIVLGLLFLIGILWYISRVLIEGKKLKEKQALKDSEDRILWRVNKICNE